ILGAPGGLVELDADGGFVREIPAADPAARHLIIAPFGAAASPSLGRLVTTNAGHGYAATTRSERMPGISVQVWQLDGLGLPKTASWSRRSAARAASPRSTWPTRGTPSSSLRSGWIAIRSTRRRRAGAGRTALP